MFPAQNKMGAFLTLLKGGFSKIKLKEYNTKNTQL